MKTKKLIKVGWEEWVALPELNLPAIRAKVDTGAKTSALHAFMIERFTESGIEKIRFGIHPIPERSDIEIYSVAQLIDEREVISSNGKSEIRYVIRTMAVFGNKKWPIEITLTNRETMNYRMLIGRSAMEGNVVVVPEQSFLLGKLSVSLYEKIKTKRHDRSFSICLLSRRSNNYTTSRIAAAAEARGHEVDIINPELCYASLGVHEPSVHFNDRVLSQYDAIIPRIDRTVLSYTLAILRQFSLLGAYCLNPADNISKVEDKLFAFQLLSQGQVRVPRAAFCYAPTSANDLVKMIGGVPFALTSLKKSSNINNIFVKTGEAADTAIQLLKNLETHFLLQSYPIDEPYVYIKCIVLGGKIITAIEGDLHNSASIYAKRKKKRKSEIKLTADERKMVLKAVRVLGLKFLSLDILRIKPKSVLIDVSSSPNLKKFERISGINIAEALVEYIENHARPTMYHLS